MDLSRREFLKLGGVGALTLLPFSPISNFGDYTFFRSSIAEMTEKGYVCGDTHIHTTNSDGHQSVDSCVEIAYKKGLDFILLTDHVNCVYPNSFNKTANDVRRIKDRGDLRVEILPSMELSTKVGHLIVYFPQSCFNAPEAEKITKVVLPYLSLKETLSRISEFGGKAIVPHIGSKQLIGPLEKSNSYKYVGINPRELMNLNLKYVVGLESINSMSPEIVNVPSYLGVKYFGASDSHLGYDIGSSFTAITNVDRKNYDLYDALTNKHTYPLSPLFKKVPRYLIESAIDVYRQIKKV